MNISASEEWPAPDLSIVAFALSVIPEVLPPACSMSQIICQMCRGCGFRRSKSQPHLGDKTGLCTTDKRLHVTLELLEQILGYWRDLKHKK